MPRRSATAIAILVGTLILTASVPAQAASKVRLYRGETSQGERIAFRVAKTDAGRLVQEININVTFACEDGTTQDWGIGWSFGGRTVPITDGAVSYDDAHQFMASHFDGLLGPLRGEGTVSIAVPALTVDEQAQLCTTGDLTWEVEFVRFISAPGSMPLQPRRTYHLSIDSWHPASTTSASPEARTPNCGS